MSQYTLATNFGRGNGRYHCGTNRPGPSGLSANIGVGRDMKIGKESVAGAIVAMEAWMIRDHANIRATETAALTMWADALTNIRGITPVVVPDPTGNPLDRQTIHVDPKWVGSTAVAIARHPGSLTPAIILRDHEVELGYFQLAPCNLAPGQAQTVTDALSTTLRTASQIATHPDDMDGAHNSGVEADLSWLQP